VGRRWGRAVLTALAALPGLLALPAHATTPVAASGTGPRVIPPLRLAAAPDAVLPNELSGGTTGIGPGSQLVIQVGGSGFFGCTANFVWTDGTSSYLGTAGHCVVPFSADTSAGPGVHFSPTTVHGFVCAAQCGTQLAQYVALGPLVYGRRRLGPLEVGHDFGLFRITAETMGLVRPAMPVWGGPSVEVDKALGNGTCMYGNGAYFNQHNETRPRAGVLLGTTQYAWNAAMTLGSGDSGSGVVTCTVGASGLHGVGGLGIATHIEGVDTGAGAVGGRAYGTLVEQAAAMATEAGLVIHVVTS